MTISVKSFYPLTLTRCVDVVESLTRCGIESDLHSWTDDGLSERELHVLPH